MSSAGTQIALRPVDKLKTALSVASVQEQFANALGEARNLFVASIIDVVGSSKELQSCEPSAIIKEALKAAVLRLPIHRGLGFAWIVPRREHDVWTPQMQVGWRGWIQLAQRTGQYRHLNVGCIFVGQRVVEDYLTGAVAIEGAPAGDDVLGFFAFFELLNGFRKALVWSCAKMEAHRDRYVPKWNRAGGAWVTHPREMAQKTVLSALLRKYGVLSVEMQQAITAEVESDGPSLPPMMPNAEPLDMAPPTAEPETTAEPASPGPGF